MKGETDGEKRTQVSWVLTVVASLPLLLMLLLLMINADYVSQLWADLPPRIGPVPCGWVVLSIFAALVIITRFVLWVAFKITWLPGRIIWVTIAVFLILGASLIVLLGPAVFQVLRTEALRQVVG